VPTKTCEPTGTGVANRLTLPTSIRVTTAPLSTLI
jgi:hypothetical protein